MECRQVTEAEEICLLSMLLTPGRMSVASAIAAAKIWLPVHGQSSPSTSQELQDFVKDWRSYNEDVWILARGGEEESSFQTFCARAKEMKVHEAGTRRIVRRLMESNKLKTINNPIDFPYCTQCGKHVHELTDNFCVHCGNDMRALKTTCVECGFSALSLPGQIVFCPMCSAPWPHP